MNAQLTVCLGSMTMVFVVTLIVTARIARRTFALQQIARLQEQRRKQAEADSAAAWAARKPIKPQPCPRFAYHHESKPLRTHQAAPQRLVPDQIWQNGMLISDTSSKLDPSLFGHSANSANFTRRFTGWPDRESRLDQMFWRDMAELYARSPAGGPTALRHDSLTDEDVQKMAEYSSMAYHMGVDAGYGR